MKEYVPKPGVPSRTPDRQAEPSKRASLDDLLRQQADGHHSAPELLSGPGPRMEKPNNTGLDDNLKAGVEHYSGVSLDDVKVHRNSDLPSKIDALAFTRGPNIFVAPGQEKYEPHEAYHAAQQKKEPVEPTIRLPKLEINDDTGLEREADRMGALAAAYRPSDDDKTPGASVRE